MSRAYSDIAFTPAVRAVQARLGSRSGYAPLDHTEDRRDALGDDEAAFIEARDGFYQATVSETGWPYVQFRGGPAGFLKVLDDKTIGYADFRGNVQYISVGNLQGNDRISIILMDYANQRRLKILGRVRLVDERDDPALVARLELPHYRARVERAVVIHVEGYDWNCPQHIMPRFTEAEIAQASAPLHAEIARLRHSLSQAESTNGGTAEALGHGPLALQISGVRQLTPRVRAFELRAASGSALPAVSAGSHLDVPMRLSNGVLSSRRYSITSPPDRRDAYEIAVLREDAGSGGSAALHADFRLGLTLHCSMPGNDFVLHDDERPAMLVAGGIGITPLQAMAYRLRADGRRFELHYAVRSSAEAAYLPALRREFGDALRLYAGDAGQRLDVAGLLARAPRDAVFYVCGPATLIEAVRAAGAAAGLPAKQIRFERFLAAPPAPADRALAVRLQRSGRRIEVRADQSILEAVEAAGVAAPSGCRNGSCGSCRVKVLAGRPEHRDSALNDAERGAAGLMCICVSRAAGDELALDL
jgi:ferredoxin-NADP reductase/predicted pyridoxine 5'-phosphate oxidase superfamily flavin-nucleotide-binding protein